MELQNTIIIWFYILGLLFIAAMVYIFYVKKRTPFDSKINYGQIFALMAIAAVIIRLVIAYVTPGYITDMNCYRYWADAASREGISNFYKEDATTIYPPVYIYMLSLVGALRSGLGIDINSELFGMMIKALPILFDIIMAYFIYSLAKREINAKVGLLLSAFVLLNPAVIFDSSVWGQNDMVLLVFTVLALYMLYKNKLVWSAGLFMVAFLFKPQVVFTAPIFLYVFIRNIIVSKDKLKSVLTLLLSVAVMVGVFFLLPLPFGIHKEPLWLIDTLLGTMGMFPQASLNAFNLFAMMGLNFVPVADAAFLGLTLNVWGYILIAAVCLYTLWLYIKNPKKELIFGLAAFLSMGVFALGHGMHERYIFPVPILLILAYIFTKDKRLIFCACLTFISLLINECTVLFFYQVYIPLAFTIAASALNMIIFIYTGYVITKLALKPPILEAEPVKTDIEFEKIKQPSKPTAKMRLEGFREQKNTITKKDGLIMLIITAVYAVVAFTNLGAVQIPKTSYTLNEPVIVEFSQPQHITQMKYYADYGEGDIDFLYSDTGEQYSPIMLTRGEEEVSFVHHQKSELYKWQVYQTDFTGKYIWIEATSGELPILEIAFYDANGNLVTPTKILPVTATTLFDEQALVPAQPTYMTDFYFDEIYHVRTAYENIHGIEPYEITHPPLGKTILASGIEMFGMTPFGWRFMGTLCGVIMLPILFILAKMMTKKTKYAAFAAILLAADFMHFAQTRIGTIDSYSILWIMLMYLFMYQFTQQNFNRQKLSKSLVPLFLSGLFFGIGAATKWLCIYAGAGLLIIFLITMYRRHQEYKYAKESGEYPHITANYKRNLVTILGWCVLFFLIIPAGIYLLSYLPYTMVTQGNAYGLKEILGNQSYMLNYHSTLDPATVHPFASKWFTWPLTIRPVLFFSQQNPAANTIATLSTMGNPLVWWSGVVASVWLIVNAIRKKHRNFAMLFLAIAALSQFMPWWFITREVFIYHYFATVPFLILLIVYWLKYIEEDFKYGKIFGIVLVASCVAMFIFFYPVITGIPANADYVNGLRWIESWPFY
ncbi:MAG: glycosyltransferase family 39 protein [Christensenellaceae bacterium]